MRADRLAAAFALTLALGFGPGCGTEPGVRVGEEHVLYDGEPYGDFIVLADAVRHCMQSDDPTLPKMVLVDDLFDCYTELGWKKVLGCTSEDQIYMVESVVAETDGELWSHELTHYFGSEREDDPCGALALRDFSLDRPDAGMQSGN
jgi:hypothetical protein